MACARGVVIATLFGVLATLPTVADAARRGLASCQTVGTTWAANEHLRLYQSGRTPDGWSVRFWACRAGTHRGHFLVSRSEETTDPHVALGGAYALFPRRECGTLEDGKSTDRASCKGGISVYDARRSSTRFVRAGRSADGYVPVFGAIAVSARGWGAWVTVDDSDSSHQGVWVLPPGGRPELVAETNAGNEQASRTALALNGDRLFWAVGDQVGSRLLR